MTHHHTALLAMRDTITAQLKNIGIHNPDNPADWLAVPEDHDSEESDENVRADVVESWNERAALVATLETHYNKIHAALLRIENNTYGTCRVCSAPIEDARLTADPTAETCIAHRESTEAEYTSL